MVVDHVHAHAQAGGVQRHHHLAELEDALEGGCRVAGVAALGCGEVPGVVAPVEAVGAAGGVHRRLLGLAGCGAGGGGRGAAHLRYRSDVEHGQQVHVAQAGVGQRLEVLHAVGAGFGESEVLAAVGRTHCRVAGREVAHMELVDAHVGRGRHLGRCSTRVPARGLQRCRVQVRHHAALRVGGQRQGVGVGHQVAHQPHAAYKDVHPIAVCRAVEVAGAGGAPDAGGRVQLHLVHTGTSARGRGVGEEAHTLRRGRPQAEVRGTARNRGPQLHPGVHHGLGRRAEEFVQRSWRLGGGGVEHAACAVFLHQHKLAAVQLGQARQIGTRHGQHRTPAHPAKARSGLCGYGACEGLQREHGVVAADGRAHACPHLACRRGIELVSAAACRHGGPLQQVAVQPHGVCLAQVGGARGQRAGAAGLGGVGGVIALHAPDPVSPAHQRPGLVAVAVILGVAFVEEVAHRAAAGHQRHLEDGAKAVKACWRPALVPAWVARGVPGVDLPAAVLPVAAAVVHGHGRGGPRRGGGHAIGIRGHGAQGHGMPGAATEGRLHQG